MKKKKKSGIFSLICDFIFIIFFVYFISKIARINDDKTFFNTSSKKTENSKTAEKAETTTIEQTEIYNENGITIKATELKGNSLVIVVENNDSKDIDYQSNEIYVNGYCVSSMTSWFGGVSSGCKANSTLELPISYLSKLGITKITDISIKPIIFYDGDDGNLISHDYVELPITTIKTNFFGEDCGFEYKSKNMLFDKNGVKGYYLGKDSKDDYYFVIENENDLDYSLLLKDLSADNVMVTELMSGSIVPPNSKTIFKTSYLSSIIGQANVNDYSKLQFKFSFFNNGSWGVNDFDTDPIEVSK